MFKRRLAAIVVTVGMSVASSANACAQTNQSGYASVNGLEMYYEIHGAGRPLVLLHGALMTIEGFDKLLPSLAKTRQVIAIEQQAHGRTADIDRPFGYEQMADDTAALLRQLGIEHADLFGYSMGGGIALQVAIRHPELVRKLVLAASAYGPDGLYPEVLENIRNLKPEDFTGSPWLEGYARVAPDPGGWPTLLAKVRQLVGHFEGWPPDAIEEIEAPALVIVADSRRRASRARGRAVPAARRRRGGRSRRPATFPARGAPRHHARLARGARRLADADDHRVSRRAHAGGQVIAPRPARRALQQARSRDGFHHLTR